MHIGKLTGVILAFSVIGATAAYADADGYTTADVNIRTGPDIEYPSIDVIPEGDDVYVEGCLRDESWCDVRWDGIRGWVYSEYLGFDYRGDTVLLPDLGLAAFSIPIISFAISDYWDRHYVGRPWYKNRARWYRYRARPRAGWRAPPAGPRKRGWWRENYRVPRGMRAPPNRGWNRPSREQRRSIRQDSRRDNWRGGDRRRGDGRGDERPRGDRPRGERQRDGGQNIQRNRGPGPSGGNRPQGERQRGDGQRGDRRRGDGQRGGDRQRDGQRGGLRQRDGANRNPVRQNSGGQARQRNDNGGGQVRQRQQDSGQAKPANRPGTRLGTFGRQ